MSYRRLLRLATVLLVLVVLAVTLYPAPERATASSGFCLVCGSRGAADAILNVLLFAPLGVLVAWSGWSARRSYLAGVLLSSLIEAAQLFVPGRDPSLADVLFNTLGIALGIFVVRSTRASLLPSGRGDARLPVGAGAAALAILGLTAYALQPTLTDADFYGQWTPNLGHIERYRGRVLGAWLGPLEVGSRRLADSDSVRALLRSDAAWRVNAVAGPAIPALGSLISIYDEQEREIVLIGPDRDELVFRDRRRAARLRLDQPDLRLVGALRGIEAGDTIGVGAWWKEGALCLSVEDRVDCGLGFTLGHGWALLLYPEVLSRGLKMLLGSAWLALLFFLPGFWARDFRIAGISAILPLAGLFGIPAVSGLMATKAVEYLGAGVGFAIGRASRRGFRRRLNRAARSSPSVTAVP